MLCLGEKKKKKIINVNKDKKQMLNLLTRLLNSMFTIMKSSFLTFQSVIVYKFKFILTKYLENLYLDV